MTWNKFFEALRGVCVTNLAGREIPKWQLFHLNEDHDIRLIAEKKNHSYRYIDKPGWRNGVMTAPGE